MSPDLLLESQERQRRATSLHVARPETLPHLPSCNLTVIVILICEDVASMTTTGYILINVVHVG